MLPSNVLFIYDRASLLVLALQPQLLNFISKESNPWNNQLKQLTNHPADKTYIIVGLLTCRMLLMAVESGLIEVGEVGSL